MLTINHTLRQRRKGQRGFTLIELLVVIAVLSILAAVVIFNITGVKNRGQAAACKTDVGTLQSAVDSYVGETASPSVPTGAVSANQAGLTTILVPAFLHGVPDGANCAVTPLTITANGGGNGFTVTGS